MIFYAFLRARAKVEDYEVAIGGNALAGRFRIPAFLFCLQILKQNVFPVPAQ